MAVPDHLLFSAIWGIFGGGMQDKIGKLLETSLRISTGDPLHRRRARFVTGDQVAIPDWADRFFLGWLFRIIAQPRVFVPRFWSARKLPGMILRYGRELPPLKSH